MKKAILQFCLTFAFISIVHGSGSGYPLGMVEWTEAPPGDTNRVWLVTAWWGADGGGLESDIGPVCYAIPLTNWTGMAESKRDKIIKHFEKLERKEDNITRTKLEAWLNSLPNNVNLHVWFCLDEGKDQVGSLEAGNTNAPARPALQAPNTEE